MSDIQSAYVYGGVTDYGGREVNEDFLAFDVLREDMLFAVVADGAGSRQCGFAFQPAVIAATEALDTVHRMFLASPSMVESYAIETLREAVMSANRSIGIFKVANEDMYSNFGVCMTCCLVIRGRYYFAHCGNTRLYLIRHSQDGAANIFQLTSDHTLAAQMVEEGTLSSQEYYSHPARNTYTSGLGFAAEPKIQSNSGSFRLGDMLVLTSDGIHYAIQERFISELILSSDNCEAAAKTLISGAKQEKMDDNMTAAMIYYLNPWPQQSK